MKILNKQMGEKIKKRRKEMNITQANLAERLNIEPKTVSRWETYHGCPELSIIPELAYELGITVDNLMGTEKNAEDEIKKEKRDIGKIIINVCKVVVTISFIALIFSSHFLEKENIFYYKILIQTRFILISIVNVVLIFFLFAEKTRKRLIYKFYKYKYKHQFPIGYKFEVKDSYMKFTNVMIILFVLFINLFLILS
jgi:transcriptional regulator with XRE-family HTH domain